MSGQVAVYLWRAAFTGRGSDTVISVAPADAVVAVYGGGGIYGSDGVSEAFGGSVMVYCVFFGGARNASRFRNAFRQNGAILEVLRQPPPAALAVWSTRKGSRPKRGAKFSG
jgi:hypothetical protein